MNQKTLPLKLKSQLQSLHDQTSPNYGTTSTAKRMPHLEACFSASGKPKDYTEIFICHARLYVFVDKYDAGRLKDLSLHMLQRTLTEFTLHDEQIGDIINLLRYSYSNTTDRPESINHLRLLVVHYSACVVEDLLRSNEFQLLLELQDLCCRYVDK